MDTPEFPIGTQPAPSHERLRAVDRTANAAHSAIDRVANKTDQTLRQVRSMAAQAKQRFQTGCKNYSEWEDKFVENTRERIRSKPLTAVAIGLAVGLLIGRSKRSR